MTDPIKLKQIDENWRLLAINDWKTFKKLVGEKAINSVKLCVLKRQNKK